MKLHQHCCLPFAAFYVLYVLNCRVWFSTVKIGVSLQGPTTDLQLTVASCELWEFLYSNAANLPHITTPVSAALVHTLPLSGRSCVIDDLVHYS